MFQPTSSQRSRLWGFRSSRRSSSVSSRRRERCLCRRGQARRRVAQTSWRRRGVMNSSGARQSWATREREEGPSDQMVRNCLFPIPVPEGLSRSEWAQLPRRRKQAGLRDVQSAVSSLNWMHGVRYRQPVRGVSSATRRKLQDLHQEVFDHLEYSVPCLGGASQASNLKRRLRCHRCCGARALTGVLTPSLVQRLSTTIWWHSARTSPNALRWLNSCQRRQ